MRVSMLPETIEAGRLYELVLSGDLVAALRVRGADQRDTTVRIELRGRLDGPENGVVGAPGGPLSRLVGMLIRDARRTGHRTADGAIDIDLDERHVAWIVDQNRFWRLVSGSASDGATPRKVKGAALLTLAGQRGTAWTAEIVVDKRRTVSWLLVDRTGPSDQPRRALARAIQNVRDMLLAAGYTPARTRFRLQALSSIPADSPFLRFETDRMLVFWPAASIRSLGGILTGMEGRRWSEVLPCVQAKLLELELATRGMTYVLERLAPSVSGSGTRHAARLVAALARGEATVRRSFVDTMFRSGSLYAASACLAPWLGSAEADGLRRSLGRDRWEQVLEHGLRRVPTGAGRSNPVWVRCAVAAQDLVEDLVRRTRFAGRRPPAATTDLVQRLYIEPRGQRLRSVWETQIKDKRLSRALEDVMLSRLRKVLPRIGRSDLVRGLAGESPDVKQRVSAIYSRRGRQLLLEDVAVLERQIDKDRFYDWDDLLAARARLERLGLWAAGSLEGSQSH